MQENVEINLLNNITRVTNKPNLNEAIADIGTTGHFIFPGAPMNNVRPATQPIATKNIINDWADDKTIISSNCYKNKTKYANNMQENVEINLINNITRVTNKPNLNKAIADTGTTEHFILAGAPMDDVQPATQPIEIEMPNGTTEKSTHTRAN